MSLYNSRMSSLKDKLLAKAEEVEVKEVVEEVEAEVAAKVEVKKGRRLNK